jgi:hypothetical protein
MQRINRIGFALFLGLMVVALIVAFSARPTEARTPGGACECADLDAPVICDGGKIFPNPCVASCRGGTHCVPYGGGGIN